MGQPYNHRGWPKDGPKGTTTVYHGCEATYVLLSIIIAIHMLLIDGPYDTMPNGGCKIVDNLI
jgi:hypothetical protein